MDVSVYVLVKSSQVKSSQVSGRTLHHFDDGRHLLEVVLMNKEHDFVVPPCKLKRRSDDEIDICGLYTHVNNHF